MKIYLVQAVRNGNPDEVISVWTQKDNAQKECDMLNEYGRLYEVEEHEVCDL